MGLRAQPWRVIALAAKREESAPKTRPLAGAPDSSAAKDPFGEGLPSTRYGRPRDTAPSPPAQAQDEKHQHESREQAAAGRVIDHVLGLREQRIGEYVGRQVQRHDFPLPVDLRHGR